VRRPIQKGVLAPELHEQVGQRQVPRILHLRDTDRICGPGKTILETANRIDRNKYDIHVGVFVRSITEENNYVRALELAGVQTELILMSGPLDRSVIGRITDLIQRNRYEVVHSHEYKGDLIARAVSRRVNVRLVSTCHGWIRNSTRAKFLAFLQKSALRRFQKVIAVSPPIRAELLDSGLKQEQVDLIFNAIVSDKYRRSDEGEGFVRNQFGVGRQVELIGCIGRLSPEKGQRDLLTAAAQLLKERNAAFLLFIGDGPDLGILQRMADDFGVSDKVGFMDHTTRIQAVYRDLDLLVLPSHTEGFPNVILEALCMEVPVIATNVGGVPAIIEDHVTGVLVEPGVVDELASALKQILSHSQDAENMMRRGRERVLDLYEFENRCRKLEAVYDSVLTA